MLSKKLRLDYLRRLLSSGEREIGALAAALLTSERQVRLHIDQLRQRGAPVMNTGRRTFALGI